MHEILHFVQNDAAFSSFPTQSQRRGSEEETSPKIEILRIRENAKSEIRIYKTEEGRFK
jgi:hypothetical protein